MTDYNNPRFEKNDRGGIAFVHPCCVCGDWGMFGYNVTLGRAMAKRDAKLAGRWYCAGHRPGADNVSDRAAA